MKFSTSKNDLRRNLKVRVPTDYPWRVLGSLVEDLRYSLTASEYDEVKLIIRKRDYEAYLLLAEAWGPQGTDLNGTSGSKFFAKYQVASCLKKFRFPGNDSSRRDSALKKFKAAEEACYTFNRSGSRKLAFLTDPVELLAFTYARDLLEKLLGNVLPDRSALTAWSRHGPGANLDTKSRNTSMYFKYSQWPYSCTSGAVRHARAAIMDDERWRGALEDDYRVRYNIPKHAILDQTVFFKNVLNVVDGNRITFVPKNSQTDRSIAIEPSMNLYLQLGIDGFIRRRLKRWGCDLDDQGKNQELARVGSKNWRDEDPFVTLDLAAASDTISISTCRLLLPAQWYHHLMELRSPVGDINGETIRYEKISSMGNGFTFALESAIFFAVVYGVNKALKGQFDRDEVAVYGDDIIVRKSVADLTVTMLNRCGFTINSEKSFFEGPFRESCGADWFNGTPVRPVFLTTMPSTVMELWCDSNRVRRVLSLRVMEYESVTCKTIDKWIPEFFSGFTGPASDTDFDSYKHVDRPQQGYYRGLWEFKRLVISPKHLRGDNFLFRKLMHSLRPSGYVEPPWSRKTWGGANISSGGNVFTVTRSNSVTVGVSPTCTSFWCEQYTDLSHASRPG